jgi:hypothetical protein
MKTTATFRVSKRSKTMAALLNPHNKGENKSFLKAMIRAEAFAQSTERHMMGAAGKNND